MYFPNKAKQLSTWVFKKSRVKRREEREREVCSAREATDWPAGGVRFPADMQIFRGLKARDDGAQHSVKLFSCCSNHWVPWLASLRPGSSALFMCLFDQLIIDNIIVISASECQKYMKYCTIVSLVHVFASSRLLIIYLLLLLLVTLRRGQLRKYVLSCSKYFLRLWNYNFHCIHSFLESGQNPHKISLTWILILSSSLRLGFASVIFPWGTLIKVFFRSSVSCSACYVSCRSRVSFGLLLLWQYRAEIDWTSRHCNSSFLLGRQQLPFACVDVLAVKWGRWKVCYYLECYQV